MKKNIMIFASIAMCILFSLFFVSCPLGLDPAWKNAGKPVFSLDLSSSFNSGESGSRALIQGGGFIYIRTVGDGSETTGAFYGPFKVPANGVFSTTEIPEGTYAGLAVIYASIESDSKVAFLEKMNAADDAFISAFEAAGTFFGDSFDSSASGVLEKNVVIVSGRENTIKLTLKPMVSIANTINLKKGETEGLFGETNVNSKTWKKQFIALTGTSVGDFSCFITPAASAKIGQTVLYDSLGKKLKGWDSNATERTHSLPENSSSLYLYIEYSGSVDLSFSIVPPAEIVVPGTGSVTFSSNDARVKNLGLILFITNVNPLDGQVGGEIPVDGEIPTNYGSGYVTLDDNGFGQILPVKNDGSPYDIAPNIVYYIGGFTVEAGVYIEADLFKFLGTGPTEGNFMLKESDGKANDFTSNAAGEIIITNPLFFEVLFPPRYFISQSGEGTGETLDSPASWSGVQAKLTALSPESSLDIYITENITISSSISLQNDNSRVSLSSWGSTPRTITVIDSITAPVILLEAGDLGLFNITISGPSSGTALATSPIKVGYTQATENFFAHLSLGHGAVIKDFTVTGNGGAVSLIAPNAQLYFGGGTITNCSAVNGGAVYAATGSNVSWSDGSSITANKATGNGGGIYLEKNAFLYDNKVAQGPALGATGINENTSTGEGPNVFYVETPGEYPPNGQTVTVNFTGLGEFNGVDVTEKKIFVFIYDPTGVDILGSEFGVVEASGSVTVPIFVGGGPLSPPYKLSAFVDIANRYVSGAGFNPSQTGPDTGDLTTYSEFSEVITVFSGELNNTIDVAATGDNFMIFRDLPF